MSTVLQPSEDTTDLTLRSCIQKVATGPEYSKDLEREEAHAAMRRMLGGEADPVQTAIYLIAMRMKRETNEENAGSLEAILEFTNTVTAPVEEVIDVADPYDGYARGLPVSAFLPAVFAASGLPSITHGVEFVGPKYGVTSRKVLAAAGIDVDRATESVAQDLANPDIGWGYVDQRAFCPALHNLVPLRTRMVKRQLITTVEVLTGPIRGRSKTHLMTGYVHKAYPPIYENLARVAGFDSAVIIRGVEGGVTPSLKQPGKIFYYSERGPLENAEILPQDLGIDQETRAVPIPETIERTGSVTDGIATDLDTSAAAAAAAAAGLEALRGGTGPARDSLVLAASIMLGRLGRNSTREEAAARVRDTLDSGTALARFDALRS